MGCNKFHDILPAYAIGSLTDEECAELETHLGCKAINGGCEACQQELDELLAAASLLTHSTTPVTPSADIKRFLIERIENEQPAVRTNAVICLPEETVEAKSRWYSYLPYVAAMVCFVVLGSWSARIMHPTAVRNEESFTTSRTPTTRQWRQQIALAEQKLGISNIQLASLVPDRTLQGMHTAIFLDSLSNEIHVLVTNIAPTKQSNQLWLWLIDKNGAYFARGPLNSSDQTSASGILILNTKLKEAVTMTNEIIVTQEEQGDHLVPTGPVVGNARMSRNP